MIAVVLAQFVMHFRLGFGCINRLNSCAHDKVQALLFQRALEGFLNFAIHAGCDDVQEFNHGDLRSQARVDGAQFKTDDARANHRQFLGDFWQGQCTGGCDDDFFVNLNPGQGGGDRA